jgi:hypothetical protein
MNLIYSGQTTLFLLFYKIGRKVGERKGEVISNFYENVDNNNFPRIGSMPKKYIK